MRSRRGVALITALWLVVGIAVVVMQFSLDARERRVLGIHAAERGVERAAAAGALAVVRARLDEALRAGSLDRAGVAGLRSSDPWLDADSLYSGIVMVDSTPVEVRVRDVGARLDINLLGEDEIKTFLGFILNNYSTADQLAQAIMDWRDADDIPRLRGGERDDYLRAGLLALPANGQFREVDDLLLVRGMTPEIFAVIRPYLTTRGQIAINLNTAPAPVLRAVPGMSDAILAQILSLRSQGRRIESAMQVMGPAQRGRAPQTLGRGTTVETISLELTFIARSAPQAPPVRLLAIARRLGNGPERYTSVTWKEW